MLLNARERDALIVHQVGMLAQQRLARGLKLNYAECVGLISSTLLELIRDGRSVAELMDLGKQLLGTDDVLPGVPSMIEQIQVEGTFPDGTKLVTVHHPVCQQEAPQRRLALRGVFPFETPLPANDLHATTAEEDESPGEVVPSVRGPGILALSEGRRRVRLNVTSFCDRPIQVGSHFHFAEVNPKLEFDRWQAVGMRLDIPAGHSVRFEPYDHLTVSLVELGGARAPAGGNNLLMGIPNEANKQKFNRWLAAGGFRHKEAEVQPLPPPAKISRALYCRTYGPTAGDVVRLGDTPLRVIVERDLGVYGEEAQFGGGKVLRSGMGMRCGASNVCDTIVVGAVVLDPYLPVLKCDVGIKDGRVRALGKSGNPDTQPGVHPDLVVGACTEIIAANGGIITAGAIDSHVHFICPQQCEEALASGITTMIGGGTGPAEGSLATTCTPGVWNIRAMFEATDNVPMNFGFTGKGNSSSPEKDGKAFARDLLEQVEGGAIGLKVHEDWGSCPAAIDACLAVADACDVQAALHSDTLNEAGCLEQTVAAIGGRCIHAYHAEGAGGGHAPDSLAICGKPQVLPSSTTPTRPYGVNTVDEHVDMLMCCHHLDKNLKEDLSFAESRIRAETIQAEDMLHDMGAISMIASDSQAMGRVGEVICRTWQTASKMKMQRGTLPEDEGTAADNFRVKRYLAKYTCNPAIAHGCAHEIGSIWPGKLADLVLWDTKFFGVKPRMIIKGGQITWSQMGLANGSIPLAQPVYGREMFGSFGSAPWRNSVLFVSRLSLSTEARHKWRVRKRLVGVQNCRRLSKYDMVLNDVCPEIYVNPQTYEVQVKLPPRPARTKLWDMFALLPQATEQAALLGSSTQNLPSVGSDAALAVEGRVPSASSVHAAASSTTLEVSSTETHVDDHEASPARMEDDMSPQKVQQRSAFVAAAPTMATMTTQESTQPSLEGKTEGGPETPALEWQHLQCGPAAVVPLAQRYMLF